MIFGPSRASLAGRLAERLSSHYMMPARRSKGDPMSISETDVLAALKQVKDPERGQDIVSLGMVTGVQTREGHVAFAIEVERERGPRLEPLRKAAEKAVEALPGVLSVSAVLTAESRAPAGRPAPPAHN